MANMVAKRKSCGAAVRTNDRQMRLVSQKKPRVSFPPASGAGFSGGEQQQNPTRREPALGGRGDVQRALYALVRESVYIGAHATHARVELAYGGSHASGARDGVANCWYVEVHSASASQLRTRTYISGVLLDVSLKYPGWWFPRTSRSRASRAPRPVWGR